MKYLIVIFVVCTPQISRASTGDANGETPDKVARGNLFFDGGAGKHLSSATSYAKSGGIVQLGVGYMITSQMALGIQFYTGSESIGADQSRPTSGDLAMGGAGLSMTVLVGAEEGVRPVITFGYDLMTILVKPVVPEKSGYNGGGIHAGVGLRMDLSQHWSFDIQGTYAVMLYHNAVGSMDAGASFTPFVDRLVGVTVDINFFPVIL